MVVTDEDLERVPLKTVRSIEIEQFTKAEREDAAVRFVKSAYYLGPDEIRSTSELDLGEESYVFKPDELAMARQLVSAMTGEFEPAQYKDEYREALEAVIEAKVQGRETVEIEAPEETGNLIDLMAALEASVHAAKAARVASGTEPVSVADAKAAKVANATRATTANATRATTAVTDAEISAATKPARRRKTA